MKTNYTLGSQIGSITVAQPTTPQQSPFFFAKVVEVILDSDVEVYDTNNQQITFPIGSIQYRPLNEDSTTNSTKDYAKPLDSNQKQLPLVNEIVKITLAPTSNIQKKASDSIPCYSTIVGVWSNPSHNAIPDAGTDSSEVLGGVLQLTDINPLYPFPGDILTEGRQGQSIRIGGYSSKENPWVDAANDGKPYIVISNGQIQTDNGVDHIVEDINKDPNSLYFLSDHTVPLNSANKKRDSYDLAPQTADQYRGNQVIINGGRLFFNAKEESLLLSAKDSVGINAKTVNLDATDYFCVDAKKIYLGAGARRAYFIKQPVILGTQFDNWMNTLLDTLQHVAAAMTNASSVSGGPVTQLNMVGPELSSVISSLRKQMDQYKSKKVFTE